MLSGRELAEMEALLNRVKLTPLLSKLLAKCIPGWSNLNRLAQSAVRQALKAGATLDKGGRLVINDQAVRDRIFCKSFMSALFRNQHLISPKTRDQGVLFRNFKHRGKSTGRTVAGIRPTKAGIHPKQQFLKEVGYRRAGSGRGPKRRRPRG